MNPLKKNDEGFDDPGYDPKFQQKILQRSCKYWNQLQKIFVLLWKTIVWTLHPLSKYHELPFKSTLQISTSTPQSENRMYVHCVVKVHVFYEGHTQCKYILCNFYTFYACPIFQYNSTVQITSNYCSKYSGKM